jgi:UDPglucose 6-dehydrogenase
MLATRISFMNDMANLCEIVGANVNMVRKGIGSDTRIGSKFLYSGCGYGGACFPKDVKALIKTASLNGYEMQLLNSVEKVNEKQKTILFEKLYKHFKGDLNGKTITLWGLAFKPDTDDMREAPALILIALLLKAGCLVKVYDPVAMQECKRRVGSNVIYCKDMYDAALNSDAILLVTEWKEFRVPSWGVLQKSMHQQVIVDGRNIYDRKEVEENEFIYYRIG